MRGDRIVTILIVEDDKSLQDVYRLILQMQGYRVEVANDGQEGLSKLRQHRPDLILLDYFMPRMDGKTFLQNFDATEYPDTRIVVASNVSDRQVLDELLSLGADRTILKANFSPSELLGLVDEIIV